MFTAAAANGVVYLRLSFRPDRVIINGKKISISRNLNPDAYLLKKLGKGDYALTIKHSKPCDVMISG
jgi:hypothetical protein